MIHGFESRSFLGGEGARRGERMSSDISQVPPHPVRADLSFQENLTTAASEKKQKNNAS